MHVCMKGYAVNSEAERCNWHVTKLPTCKCCADGIAILDTLNYAAFSSLEMINPKQYRAIS